MGYTPHVVVVGGGALGTATARDLAMRGLEVTLVEQETLAAGSTGSAVGLLSSGARSALSDPETTRRYVEENQTLRNVASHCLEETRELFVTHASDDQHYEEVRDAASAAGLPVEELSGDEIREREPALSDAIEGGFEVPAGTVDPSCLAVATARSALAYGATIRTRTTVTDLVVEDDAITGVRIQTADGDAETIQAQYVVNAAGESVDDVAGTAGIDLPVERSGRVSVVLDGRLTERAVARSRPQSEASAVVPHGHRTTLGTADASDAESDKQACERVDELVDRLAKIVPSIERESFLRKKDSVHAWHGDQVEREGSVGGGPIAVLDHEQRDGVWGLSTVVGGTLTTHRLAAERVTDQVCAKFGIDRPSHTASTPLPGSSEPPELDEEAFDLDSDVIEASVRRLGDRAAEVLDTAGPNPVVCPCENVTRAEVKDVLSDETAHETDLEAVRVRTGAGTGSCNGGRCVHRLASLLYLKTDKESIEREVEAFYQNRWDEQRHVRWGEQLAQAMENYALHATTMNRGTRGEVDLDEFDSGPEWDDDDVDPYGGFTP